jgi:hypothetical protein
MDRVDMCLKQVFKTPVLKHVGNVLYNEKHKKQLEKQKIN